MFDNRKIRHLRKLPEGNSIVLIWVMLLAMAGKCNDHGKIYLTENIPYTPKMLADEREESLCCKYCIICLNGMTFTHHKTVAVRVVHVLRADVHLFKIQRYKHINDTHVAADVAALAGNYHFHYFLPQIIRQTTQFLVFTHDFHSPLKYALTSSSIGSYKSGAMPMYLHASYRTGTTFSWIPTQWWMYGPSTIFVSRRFRFCTSTHT